MQRTTSWLGNLELGRFGSATAHRFASCLSLAAAVSDEDEI